MEWLSRTHQACMNPLRVFHNHRRHRRQHRWLNQCFHPDRDHQLAAAQPIAMWTQIAGVLAAFYLALATPAMSKLLSVGHSMSTSRVSCLHRRSGHGIQADRPSNRQALLGLIRTNLARFHRCTPSTPPHVILLEAQMAFTSSPITSFGESRSSNGVSHRLRVWSPGSRTSRRSRRRRRSRSGPR